MKIPLYLCFQKPNKILTMCIINLTEEEKIKNLEIFKGNVKRANVESVITEESFVKKLMNATCAMSEDSGCAYDGALIVHINLTTQIAQRLAKMVCVSLPINETSLLKVCCLQHLSKVKMFARNMDDWQVKHGKPYTFALDSDSNLKMGDRSLQMATSMGISFSDSEWEAMKCLDKMDGTSIVKHESPLCTVIRQANELAYSIQYQKYKKTCAK